MSENISEGLMGSKEAVSIVIPTYYRNESLRAAIDSALTQEYDPIEAIVVDDSGERHAQSTVAEFDSVTYVPLPENQGAQRARAAGVARASGKYIQFLDDDDRLLPGKLSRQVPVLSANDTVGVVYCGLQWAGGPRVYPRTEVHGDVLSDALRVDTSPCMMGTMLIEQEVLSDINILKHDHAADDIGLKIQLAQSTDFGYVNDILVRRGNSPDSLGTSLAAAEARFEIIEIHDDLYGRFPDSIRREAVAEAYLVRGQALLRASLWSHRAIHSFALATYYQPDTSIEYIGSLVSSLFGRPGYSLLRRLYSRFVLGTNRRGKRT